MARATKSLSEFIEFLEDIRDEHSDAADLPMFVSNEEGTIDGLLTDVEIDSGAVWLLFEEES